MRVSLLLAIHMHSAAAFVIKSHHITESKAPQASQIQTSPTVTSITDESKDNKDHHHQGQDQGESLSCRILGFYPFPTPPPPGPLGWLFRDTHQAVMIQSSLSSSSSSSSSQRDRITVIMDFMTKDGEFHPVWYNENVKWNVFLGGTIEGEVRVRFLGGNKMNQDQQQDHDWEERILTKNPNMKQLLQIARSYNCEMNLYGNNCRMFAARMEREVERLNFKSNTKSNSNGEEANVEPGIGMGMDMDTMDTTRIRVGADADSAQGMELSEMAADVRCAVRILAAGILPALYPLSALFFSYEGLHDLW
jgi:hypothetical protein